MKRSYRGVLLLAIVVLINIILTQHVVNQFFYEKYTNVVILSILNILVFPIAYVIYRKEVNNNT